MLYPTNALTKTKSPGCQRREHGTHAADCTTSCPDCLRSFDNRRIHGALDWRLALDMVELSLHRPMNWQRWLGRTDVLVRGFISSFGQYRITSRQVAGLTVLVSSGTRKAVILGHPLWRRQPQYFRPEQAQAAQECESLEYTVNDSDLFELDRPPQWQSRGSFCLDTSIGDPVTPTLLDQKANRCILWLQPTDAFYIRFATNRRRLPAMSD